MKMVQSVPLLQFAGEDVSEYQRSMCVMFIIYVMLRPVHLWTCRCLCIEPLNAGDVQGVGHMPGDMNKHISHLSD